MPVIPTFTGQMGMPGAPAAQMDVGQAGQVAEALARGTGGMSDEMNAFAAQYAQQKRAIAASDQMVGIDNQLSDAAVRWSRVPDMEQAVSGFNDEATGLRQKALDGIQDPLVQNMVAQRFDEARITHSQHVRAQSFGLEASAAKGTLDMQLAQLAQTAATAPTVEARAQAVDDAQRAIASRSPLYLSPEEAATKGILFRSNVQKVQALDFIKRASESPDISRLSPLAISDAILDPKNFQGLLPAEREQLSSEAVRLGKTITAMRLADQAHNDAVAAKALTRTQAANAAAIIAQVTSGTPASAPVDPAALADQVRTQQISEAGFSAILAAQAKRDAGRDDVATSMDLWRRANAGEDVSHDALQAYADGKLSHGTAIDLEKAIDAREKGADSAVDKANFSTLKTALNGYAIEQGLFAGADKQEKAQLWTEAQSEWTRRVLVGHESSAAVLQDMLGRYVKHPASPEGLPQPRLGAVGSLADVAAVARRTQAAHAAGTMDDATFNAEKALLLKYQQAYAAEAARTAPAKGGGKSASLGASGDMQ